MAVDPTRCAGLNGNEKLFCQLHESLKERGCSSWGVKIAPDEPFDPYYAFNMEGENSSSYVSDAETLQTAESFFCNGWKDSLDGVNLDDPVMKGWIHVALGNTLYRYGNYIDSTMEYLAAGKENPKECKIGFLILNGMVRSDAELGEEFNDVVLFDTQEAITAYSSVTGKDIEYYSKIGNNLIKQDPTYSSGEINERAVDAYNKAIGYIQKESYLYDQEVTLLSKLGRLDEAVGVIEKKKDLDKLEASFHAKVGYIYYRRGKYYEAGYRLESATNLDPTNVDYHNLLGWIKFFKNRPDLAAKEFKTAIALNDNADDKKIVSYNGLGWALFQQGNFNEADKEFRWSMQMVENRANLKPGRATELYQALYGLKNYEDYVKFVDSTRRAVSPSEEDADLIHALGWALFWTGHKEEAATEFRRAVKLDDKFAPHRYMLGWALYEQGKYGDAANEFYAASTLNNKDPTYSYMYAWALRKLNKLGEACSVAQRAAWLDDNNIEFLTGAEKACGYKHPFSEYASRRVDYLLDHYFVCPASKNYYHKGRPDADRRNGYEEPVFFIIMEGKRYLMRGDLQDAEKRFSDPVSIAGYYKSFVGQRTSVSSGDRSSNSVMTPVEVHTVAPTAASKASPVVTHDRPVVLVQPRVKPPEPAPVRAQTRIQPPKEQKPAADFPPSGTLRPAPPKLQPKPKKDFLDGFNW